MILIPEGLKTSDAIGIVSPSSPVTQDLAAQFHAGISFLEELGFSVVIGEHVHSITLGYAATPREKADDINRMFADKAIKAILCSQGGDTANACLPYLDWDCIRENPKIFMGISDITVLLNAIQHRTGLVTFHGNDVIWGWGRSPQEYDRHEFITRFMEGGTGLIPANRERKEVRKGTSTGKLLGGNLRCLLKLAGTPYLPDFNEAILFVEALRISAEGCAAGFQQLGQMGVFDQINGVIVGYIDGMQKDGSPDVGMEDILAQVTEDYDFPILKVNDFGHNCSNTVLPVGGQVRFNTEELTVEILEKCVR